MVSKVAVIALVAIVAVPILLGYAFALEEYTETRYSDDNKYTNVTPLILNSSTYDLSEANMYSLNSDVFRGSFSQGTDGPKFYPKYISNGTAISPIVKQSTPYVRSANNWTSGWGDTYNVQLYIVGSDNYNASNHVDLNVYDADDNFITTISNIRYLSYSDNDKVLRYTYQYNYINPANLRSDTLTGTYKGTFVTVGSGNWNVNGFWDVKAWTSYERSNNNWYVDISKGYTLNVGEGQSKGPLTNIWYPNNFVEDFTYTIDLDTITGANQYIQLNMWSADPDNPLVTSLDNHRAYLKKNDGVWQLMSQYTTGYGDPPPVAVADLIDTPGQNVYQIKVNRTGIEVRYVGNWPSQVGEANYYRSWSQDFLTPITQPQCIKYIGIESTRDAVMRFDQATYRSYSYNITEDLQYNPANIIGSNNVVTKLQSVTRAGSSITFGGNTYTVTDYNLMLGTHKIPLSGLRFESVLNENNTYDNKINGHVVSTTATPSTVTFDGKWLVNVASAKMTSYTYTGTQWQAGEFGWDGMDHNFLIVGLITCLGVFIGCGIYARKSRSGGLLPLMIVTGCAAAVFFIML